MILLLLWYSKTKELISRLPLIWVGFVSISKKIVTSASTNPFASGSGPKI